MPIHQAQGATLHIDGKPVPGEMLGMSMDDVETKAWRVPIGRQTIEFDLSCQEGESESWWRYVEAMHLRDFAPCLPEPFRSAMFRRAEKLMATPETPTPSGH